MWEPPELKDLRAKILGTEMELELLFKDLEKGEAELSYNIKLQERLVENIHFLQKESPIVSIAEYQKAKQQLSIVSARINHYSKKLGPVRNKAKRLEEEYSKDMDTFLDFYKKNRERPTNLLVFKNERNKAKKDSDSK